MTSNARNTRTLGLLVGIVVGMVGLSYASVPFYRWFCQVTGFGGTTQRAEAPRAPAATGQTLPMIRVRFNADVNRDLPWSFVPLQHEVLATVGEPTLIHYRATNTGKAPIVGTATFNVTPDIVGAYFNKIACFCFAEQRLDPGEAIDMPVEFFIDPAILSDRAARDVLAITLSYTFFKAPPEKQQNAKPQQAEQRSNPDASPRTAGGG